MTWHCWPYGRPEWEALGHRNRLFRSAFLRLWDTWDTSPVFFTSCVRACVRAHIRDRLTHKSPKCPKPYQTLGFYIPLTLPIVSHQLSHIRKDVQSCLYLPFPALLRIKARQSWSHRSLRMPQFASACCSLLNKLPVYFLRLAFSVCCQTRGMKPLWRRYPNQRIHTSNAAIDFNRRVEGRFQAPLGPPGAPYVYGDLWRSSCEFPILFRHLLFLFSFRLLS